jgi:3-oxo-5-alpha-steroid 4-dehydrogenase 3
MFRFLVCPHYTCECIIYFSLAICAAPDGHLCNRTMICALLFVLANLGATASGTRQWYINKFGLESVAGKWNMIPYVF